MFGKTNMTFKTIKVDNNRLITIKKYLRQRENINAGTMEDKFNTYSRQIVYKSGVR